ncbi:PREDICTED: uncharacterized protein LOC107348781 [Acropora digitifera]|uniref:uncharacterized protein LOC107348781 n=1 Tax=Acropora digitifera TaxID=70779 RepID=UPI00077A6169|nr:PREDICTED: uncharacterized protein LOC107348781 [Acropora digitifera]
MLCRSYKSFQIFLLAGNFTNWTGHNLLTCETLKKITQDVLEPKKEDVDEHIINISSYKLSFFQKLVLCRGLKFAIPKRVSSIDVKASFEKAYWKLEPRLPDEFRDLAASTPRSVAQNYIHRKNPKPPQTLLKAIHQFKRRDDIVLTKPDKGSGVVVMDKEEYLRLLADASINNVTKFRIVKPDRPKCRGRPPKHYHPLLHKEKELESLVRRILPTAIAESVRPSGSRLAHLYGLPKTHKEKLAMRPILSATQTYNYALAKWLDDKLKPLVTNQYMIRDTFEFVNEVHELVINNGDILVSYDVSSLFTNVSLEETIHYSPTRAATKDQLFTFNGQLYEQTDGVAMGSPLGPLLANAFMCSIEETLELDGKMPTSPWPVSSPAVSDRLDPIRVVLPFKDQASADIVRAQLKDLSHKIQTTVQPVFVSQKIERDLKLREAKPPIVNQQCLVYEFQCDLCDAGYSKRRYAQGEECEKNNACMHIIVHIPGEKPHRISENLRRSLKICKDLQTTFEDEDL